MALCNYFDQKKDYMQIYRNMFQTIFHYKSHQKTAIATRAKDHKTNTETVADAQEAQQGGEKERKIIDFVFGKSSK